MAVIGSNIVTLADIAKRSDANGNVQTDVIDLMSQFCPMIKHGHTVVANDGDGHKTTQMTGIPTVTWRLINQGVLPSKGTSQQVRHTTGMLEAFSEIDEDLARLNGNSAAWRMTEEKGFLEAFAQEVEETAIYGNTSSAPAEFTGLGAYYNTRSTAVAESAKNVVHGGGAGSDNTSIWFVTWDDDATMWLVPKGLPAGLQVQDMGMQLKQNAGGVSGAMMRTLVTNYQWKIGMSVRDWRYNSRVANIDVSDLAAAGTAGYAGPDLVNLMIEAQHKLRTFRRGRVMGYASRSVLTALDKIAAAKSNVYLQHGEFAGEPVTMFRGIPLFESEKILETEALVPNS